MSNYAQDQKRTILQYDAEGFIISLKNTTNDVSKIDKNVEQIRDILVGLGKELENQYSRAESLPKQKLSALEQALIDAQIKPADFSDLIREQANPLVQSTLALDRAAKSIEDLIAESMQSEDNKPQPKANPKRRSIEINSTEDVIREFGNNDRQRDANGRFVGSNSEQTTLSKVTQTIGTAIKGVLPSNPEGVDLTLDAINEVATVLSPVKRAAGFMLRPLTGWMKSRKRNEPLPKEQSDHNRKLIKVLEKIAANNGGGLFGLLKILPLALAGIGSTVAAAVAGLGPVLATALAGAVGAYLGSKIHDRLDETETGQAVNEFIGNAAARTLASLGNDAAKEVVEAHDKADDAERYKYRKENPAWYSNDGVYRFARKLGVQRYMKENTPGSMLYQKQYGGQGVNGKEVAQFGAAASSGKLVGNNTSEKTLALIRKHEGYKEKAYWDVNAYRVGYGSDTLTDKNGKITSVNKTSTTNRKGAERDLFRRTKIFANEAREKVGAENWDKLPDDTKAALTSVAYNYGSLPKKVVKAVQTNDISQISESVRSLESHNDGINKNRRNDEANIIKNSIITEPNKHADSKGKRTESQPEQKVTQITNAAELLKQKSKMNQTLLNLKTPVTPTATRAINFGSSYIQPKTETTIQPAKEFLTSPKPQEVVVKNQNNGTINQNVSNRLLAHAITGGLGMGDKWNV
ncbi:glycoside hydrolase family protein [Acinetobacter beijerinckii]|uniref:glycoside hydrolase family protein n=1 Tax=Acinetobacter beijerinckii TaxID=262668 RepID=UPI003AF48022